MIRRVNGLAVIPRRRIPALAMLCVGAGALAVAAPSLGSSGGSGLQPGAGSTPSSPSTAEPVGVVQPANMTVRAHGNGITIVTRASTFLHEQLRFSGRVPARDAGHVIEIERLGHQPGSTWKPTVQTRARGNGSFSVTWSSSHIGLFSIRALVHRRGLAQLAAVSPTVTVTVYRTVIATEYGPGFYGRTTACGELLRRTTLGTANRTLPCGTPVAIYYGGHMIVVPVIDRGPYANHANYDLTEATARALGMPGIATIGAAPLSRH